MDNQYNLSCSLYGHEKDIRDLAPLYQPSGAFVSVSRDITSRIWVPNESDIGYREGLIMSGHENFISCVCVMPPDCDYPQGVILTGSNDCQVLAYTLNSPSPIYKLGGHSSTVCSLAAGNFGMFASGSWDHTAKLWCKKECITTLVGHEEAVWCVAFLPHNEQMITGSGDKTIRLWKATNGNQLHIFKGHTDCVRCLAIMDPYHFLSSSNDATIRLWELSGNCLQVFIGHSSYVYGLACLGPDMDFVSCGEDRNVKIWKRGECTQTIPHPAQSVWCVCALPNGDIVTGASDGIVRVFTQNPCRVAEPRVLAEYKDSVEKSTIPAIIGDIKTEDLPGPDALHIPGNREGQTLMIRRKNTIEAYQWSHFKGEWQKVGDVIGGESSNTNGKSTMFEGKKYDFVFEVSVSEGYPMLKLPYNISEDPYMAAHKFLEKNELSPLFLDQVATFIEKQTGALTLGEDQSSLVDPYTGSSRYQAGSKSQLHQNAKTSDNFTEENEIPAAQKSYSYFPEKDFIKFDQININGILSKLEEFNGKVDSAMSVKATEMLIIKSLLVEEAMKWEETTQVMLKLLQWPAELLFPVLDALRFALLNPTFNKAIFSCREQIELIQFFSSLINQMDDPKTQFLILRAMCNAFQHEVGKVSIVKNITDLYEKLTSLKYSTNKNIQIALASLFLNLSIVFASSETSDASKSLLLTRIGEIIILVRDEEAFFRYIVAIGTIITHDEVSTAAAKSLSLDVKLISHSCLQHAASEKIKKSAESVLSILG